MHGQRNLLAASALGAFAALIAPYMVAPSGHVPAPSLVTIHTASSGDTGFAVQMKALPVNEAAAVVIQAIEPAVEAVDAMPARAGLAAASSVAAPKSYHTVQPGESLFRIASRLGMSMASLAGANGLTDANMIYAGQRLVIPPTGGAYHVVRPGETLASIALQHNVRMADILDQPQNNITDPTRIFAGQTLFVATLGTSTRRLAEAAVTAAWPTLIFPPNGWTTDSASPTFRWHTDGYSQLWIAPVGSSVPIFEGVLPKGQDTYTLGTQLAQGATYRWRVRANPFPPGDSVYTWTPWSREFTFTTPGGRSWKDGALVSLVAPANGAISSSLTPTLTWSPPTGSTYFEMVIIPGNNPAQAVRFVQKIDTNSYSIPGPPYWYGMLPDTSYSWRVRVNNASVPLPEEHSSWGPWSETWSFRTPTPPSNLIGVVAPQQNARVSGATPTLTWANADNQVFFYEVQISKDSSFTADPQFAWAPLYWETVHGGMSSPPNSYTVASRYPLDRSQTYYWRVRPAIPGGGQAVLWSSVWQFSTP